MGTIAYIPHGGGPLPLLHDPAHAELVQFLEKLGRQVPKPEAIVLISAHWEEAVPRITSAAQPSLLYDYYGFPEEAYSIRYPAAGNPQLAETVWNLLKADGFSAVLDNRRGFDHGLFVPLKLMYPKADIPCIELSLLRGLDASAHLRLGKVLGELKREHLLPLHVCMGVAEGAAAENYQLFVLGKKAIAFVWNF